MLFIHMRAVFVKHLCIFRAIVCGYTGGCLSRLVSNPPTGGSVPDQQAFSFHDIRVHQLVFICTSNNSRRRDGLMFALTDSARTKHEGFVLEQRHSVQIRKAH